MLTSPFTNNDSATVSQTWIRTQLGENLVIFTNDTKRALGHREQVIFRTKSYKVKVGTTEVPMVQMNVTIERQLSTDVVPIRDSRTISMSKAQQDAVTATRTTYKDFQALWNGKLTVNDAAVDDLIAFRAHIP